MVRLVALKDMRDVQDDILQAAPYSCTLRLIILHLQRMAVLNVSH